MFNINLSNNEVKKGYSLNYKIFLKKFQKFKINYYGLDASGSGLQMLSLLLKSKNLGEKCGLLKSNNIHDLYTRVKNFVISQLDKDVKLKKAIIKIPGFFDLINNRKFSKLPIMTIPYNSTKFGRVDQMLESLINYCCFNGLILNNSYISEAKKIFFRLDDIFMKWCVEELPECFSFIKIIREMIFSPEFENNFITNGFVSFKYKMSLKSSSRRKIGIRLKSNAQKTKISIVFLKSFDTLTKKEIFILKKKINNSFIANIVHSLDARIATNLLNYCLKNKIKIYTIHDCFRIDINKAGVLNYLIKENYIELYHYDFLLLNNLPVIKPDLDIKYLLENFDIKNFVKF